MTEDSSYGKLLEPTNPYYPNSDLKLPQFCLAGMSGTQEAWKYSLHLQDGMSSISAA